MPLCFSPVLSDSYHVDFAAAYVRGRRADAPTSSDEDVLRWGLEQEELRLHKFKRKVPLPRVKQVLGTLRGIGPSEVLDVGSGRGAFLWPLMVAFPGLAVTTVEADPIRARDLRAVRDGGVDRLRVIEQDARECSLADDSIDVVCVLEVLEHLRDPHRLARRALALARRFVIASVPSKPDDNPEHVQLFSPKSLEATLVEAGATKVDITHVRGHMVAVAKVG